MADLWPNKCERTLQVYLPRSARERDFVDQKIVNRHEEVDGVHIEFTEL